MAVGLAAYYGRGSLADSIGRRPVHCGAAASLLSRASLFTNPFYVCCNAFRSNECAPPDIDLYEAALLDQRVNGGATDTTQPGAHAARATCYRNQERLVFGAHSVKPLLFLRGCPPHA